jgi:putative thioredoxin
MQKGSVFECGLDEFEARVLEASHATPVLVDFWADWCSPCHAIAPHLGAVVDQRAGAIRLVKIEVDAGDNMKLAGRYRLRGFPTVMLFVRGEEIARFSGARATQWIQHWLDEHLPDD